MSNGSAKQSPSPEELNKHFQHACSLHEEGNLNDAVEIYEYLLSLVPDSALLRFNCGLALFDLHSFSEAEIHYQKACEITPEDPDIHFNRGLNFRKVGKLPEGIKSFEQAVVHGDSSLDVLYTLALSFQDLGVTTEAARHYDLVLARDPDHQSSLNNYAYLCHKNGDSQKAESLYRRLLEHNPDHLAARHMLNALAGQTPETAPLAYVESVFDNYAGHFEESLVGKLQYRTPGALWKRYRRMFQESQRKSCLDLGCGTGLAGVEFAPCCERMVGVDISEEMLAVAKEKNIYRRLVKDDIVNFLENSRHSYDLILAADVFTYLGDLKNIFTACFNKTEEKGLFLFSVEESAADGFQLKQTGRFGHSLHYIQSLCQESGYTILDHHVSKLRQDKREWIKGSLFILQK